MNVCLTKCPRISWPTAILFALTLAIGTTGANAGEHKAAKGEHSKSEPKKSEHGKGEHAKTAPAEGGHGEAEKGEGEHGEAADDEESNGIKLGEFKIRTDYPVEAQKCTVRFVLYASVDAEHLPELRKLVKEHQQKVRDAIITATRLAPLNVFEEADLATFRRRILVHFRRTLPELKFDELYLSDFGLLVRTL